ncbi:hypothetical protein [Amycolatopsis sp. lyj-109]|uniref:hypothetical protein n=1 Tax=Amycolatopsis sp. lyj-109 TaxID=2789287 RepID=UPI00397D5D81
MGNKARTALAALAGAAAVTAGAVAFAGASSAAGPSPAPFVQAAQATCVVDGSGYCTVSHSLGAIPEAILVTPIMPDASYGYLLGTVQGSYTTTTFRVRALTGQDTPKTYSQIWFSYAVYAPPSTPGSSTPPVTSWEPPTDTTTQQPPPSTTVSPT